MRRNDWSRCRPGLHSRCRIAPAAQPLTLCLRLVGIGPRSWAWHTSTDTHSPQGRSGTWSPEVFTSLGTEEGPMPAAVATHCHPPLASGQWATEDESARQPWPPRWGSRQDRAWQKPRYVPRRRGGTAATWPAAASFIADVERPRPTFAADIKLQARRPTGAVYCCGGTSRPEFQVLRPLEALSKRCLACPGERQL